MDDCDAHELYDARTVTNAPSYDTKHLDVLSYRLGELDTTLTLHQSSTTHSTSSSLWLSAQVLAAWILQCPREVPAHTQAVELGSGTGFLALVLALTQRSKEVIATDTPHVVDTLLRSNLERNAPAVTCCSLRAMPLDWTSEFRLPAVSPRLVIATDTIYAPYLVDPFWRTFASLLSHHASSHGLIALERRDPGLIDDALHVARASHGLILTRVDPLQVTRAVEASLRWFNQDIWDGVEVWRVTRGGNELK